MLDDISLFGSYDDSIFTDAKGHQGKIVVNTGALIWLTGLYKVNLRTNDADTGFNTDLHTIAENIMDLQKITNNNNLVMDTPLRWRECRVNEIFVGNDMKRKNFCPLLQDCTSSQKIFLIFV